MREKLKQKKGFTIIELMAVIVIIAIIATLVITSVISYRERAKEEYISALKDQLELAARSYYSDNPKSLPRGQIEDGYKIYNSYVMASNLMVNNYFTNNLVDDEGNDCSSESYVTVSNVFGDYNYESCLICDGKVLNGNETYCKVQGPEIVNKSPYCSIKVEDTDREYTKKLSVYTNSTIKETPVNVAADGNYYVFEPGLYEFKVENAQGEAYCSTNIYMEDDTTPPYCSISCSCNADESNCSCVTTWSDDGALKSVKDSIGHLDYTYPFSYDNFVSNDGNNLNPATVNKSNIKNYSVTVTDQGDNEFTCTGNDDDAKVDCNCELYDYSSCLICSCNNDSCTISCRTNPACSSPDDDEDDGIEIIVPDPEPSTPSTPTDPDEDDDSIHDGEEENPDTGAPGLGACFLAGTKVLTNNGYKNIEDIAVGDYVLSYNETTQSTEYNKVYQKMVHPNNSEELYELTIKGEILKVTEAHRFYIKEKGSSKFIWKRVSEIRVGDVVLDSDNLEHKITNVNHYKHFGTVYNFGVENNSNYYVSGNRILVHNAAGSGVNSSQTKY